MKIGFIDFQGLVERVENSSVGFCPFRPEYKLSIRRQAELLEDGRSVVYYRLRSVSDANLMLMRRIDELRMNHPFVGSRMLRRMRCQHGPGVRRSHVRTLRRRMPKTQNSSERACFLCDLFNGDRSGQDCANAV